MLKKIKELLGFPTEQEKADAKTEVSPAPVASENVFPFPKGDKPEQESVKPKAKRAPKAKVEGENPAARKAPAKKPAAKKPAAKKEAVSATPKKPRQTKAV